MLKSQIFPIRRAVERLRDGLFDPVAVSRLTVEEEEVLKPFTKGLMALHQGHVEPLCLCGSYGQGKSHTILYLKNRALCEGYAASVVQLDIREVPFHQFPIVYRTIMENLSLPDGLTLANAWKKHSDLNYLNSIDDMPHRFHMILKAMLSQKPQQILKKKNRRFPKVQPKEHETWLEQALTGYNIPVKYLREVFSYRNIEGFQKQSLLCRGNEPYLQMVLSLSKLLKEIGYKGFVLFFDEGESITQATVRNRAKGYALLDQLFQKNSSLYPIFAFTNDFFYCINQELYDKDQSRFSKNYAQAFEHVHRIHLNDFASQKWEILLDRLIQLYEEAYQIELPSHMKKVLRLSIQKAEGQEIRFKLKTLVHKLDMESQLFLLKR